MKNANGNIILPEATSGQDVTSVGVRIGAGVGNENSRGSTYARVHAVCNAGTYKVTHMSVFSAKMSVLAPCYAGACDGIGGRYGSQRIQEQLKAALRYILAPAPESQPNGTIVPFMPFFDCGGERGALQWINKSWGCQNISQYRPPYNGNSEGP